MHARALTKEDLLYLVTETHRLLQGHRQERRLTLCRILPGRQLRPSPIGVCLPLHYACGPFSDPSDPLTASDYECVRSGSRLCANAFERPAA